MEYEYNRKERQKRRSFQSENSTENDSISTSNNTHRSPKDNYNKDNGDLFYGLASERGRYIRETNPKFNPDDPENAAMIIDVYNNGTSMIILNKNAKKISTNRLLNFINNFKKDKLQNLMKDPEKYAKDIKVNNDLRADISSRKIEKYPLWNDYFEAGIRNEKFNISNIFKETVSKYNSDYYHTWHVYGGSPAPRLLWKRGSKLGIEIAASNQRTKIHFILDGLDIKKVVNKTKGPTPLKAGPGESITASELRYAYRNRTRLAGRIHFYENGKETIAPWDKDPELWQKYTPRNKSRMEV
ncbi:hypothetical protein [Photorhabdus stackebrandtii]|uniref:Uncharacterized protein n=1 Tax=Photorhabdus stackebrandtii TaxID=1123042 RepID=A0A7X5TKC4_9GAMM|nr:hypothetical protein [Photorhabdus stackebrandtii]NHB95209.1 hypothetical protein [Photorhabdus stackebrandtii]